MATASTSRTSKVTADVKIVAKRKPSPSWLNTLYGSITISEEDLIGIYDLVKYQGFNRDEVLAQLEEKIQDPKMLIEIIVVCSLRGPRQAENVKLSNGKTLRGLGIPASDQKGTSNISCQRISAATADLAAAFFKRLDVPKRITKFDLPGWLQFPTAGSIKMPELFRSQHLEFTKEFSVIIGGAFNEQIYSQMVANAYIDPKLKLFD